MQIHTASLSTRSTLVYAANSQDGRIQTWSEGSAGPTRTIATNSTNLFSLFVSLTGEIYVYNWNFNQVDVWLNNLTGRAETLSVSGPSYSIFVGSNGYLYCSLYYSHTIIKRSLNSSDNQLTTVAGTGCPGYLPNRLYHPHGIFVTVGLDLYVADSDNHRIQIFRPGQLNGTTAAGRDAPETIALRYPTAVTLDADERIYIVDSNNNRIVRSGPAGFRCIIGCTGVGGSASNQLSSPNSMAFDSYGNIFVVDSLNNRVQKFLLSSNTCGK